MADKKKNYITNKREFYRLDDRVQIRVKRLSSFPAKDSGMHQLKAVSPTGMRSPNTSPSISVPRAPSLFHQSLFPKDSIWKSDFSSGLRSPVHINAVVLRSEKAETAVSWQLRSSSSMQTAMTPL